MRTKTLHINYPSKGADEIGGITALIRDELLNHFEQGQVSFSFSSNKQSGYVMIYPTVPIFTLRVSNHSPTGSEVDAHVVQTMGNKVIVNAEAVQGQLVSESVLADMIKQIKESCAELQTKI